MISQSKSTKKRILFLLIIIVSHLLPLVLSALYDKSLHPPPRHNLELSKPKFWFWFFMWWSAWASLLTILWAFYKLLRLPSTKKSIYGEQLADIMVAETNLLSGVIFCWGGFLLSKPKKPFIFYPLVGQISTIKVWYFYNFFWHLLAPGLVFYYFWEYSSVDQLKKQKKLNLVNNALNPIIYLVYNMARPHFSSYYPKKSPNRPYTYPPDYPYAPFFWINAKVANTREFEVKQLGEKNKFYFWHSWPSWLQSLTWLTITVFFWLLVFSGLFLILIKIKGKKNLKPFFVLNLVGFGSLLFLSSNCFKNLKYN